MNKKESDQFFDKVFYGLLLEKERQARLDPKNQKDYEMEYQLLAELTAMGYHIRFGFELEFYPFTKEDEKVVPVIARYFGKFESRGNNASLCRALGRKGLYAATEPLMQYYYDFRPPNYDSLTVMIIMQSLREINNPNYIPQYIEMISDEDYRPEHLTWIIELLGKLKAREAIPQMLSLLNIEPFGTYLLNERQYLITLECIRTLGKFNDYKCIPFLKKFLEPEKLPQYCKSKEWSIKTFPSAAFLKNIKNAAEKSIARILKYSK